MDPSYVVLAYHDESLTPRPHAIGEPTHILEDEVLA